MNEKTNGHHASHQSDTHSDPSLLVTSQEDTKMPHSIPDHVKAIADEIGRMTPEEYALADKKLLWKLDTRLIPWMT